MSNVKVSIVTTVYNAEKDLPRLLDSMKAVKNQEIEFFLIDNGSSDNSYEICKKYADEDSRFTIYQIKENIGYIRARNLGIEKCSGNYVGFCDSDDFLELGGYDIAIKKIEETNCDFFIGAYRLLDGNNEFLKTPPFEEGVYNSEQVKSLSPLFFGPYAGKERLHGFVWKNVYRKEILLKNNIRFNEVLKPYEDQIFNVDVMKNSSVIVSSNTVLYDYVVNLESITAKLVSNFSVKEEYERIVNLYKEYEKRITNKIEKEALCNHVLSSLYVIFLNCAKGKGNIKTYKNEFKTVVKKSFIDVAVKNSSKKQNTVLGFVKTCMRFKTFGLLIKIIKISIKNRG